MKKSLFYIAISVGFLLAGCNSIKEINERLDEHEERLSALEEQVKEMNTQIDAIQKLLSGKFFVRDVFDLEDGSGYKLVLVDADGKTYEKTVLNGEDGKDPAIGVSRDTDGNWYWTLNGQWLLAGGEKVRANGTDGSDGKDGVTPSIKLENGKWYVSLDGVTWTYAGEAVTEARCLISAIDADSDPYNVIFTLSSGGTFTVPKAASAVKLQLLFDESPFAEITEGGSASTGYEIVAPEGITYSIMSYEPEGWVVIITPPQSGKGTITVNVPVGTKSGKIMFALNGSDGSSFVRIVQVGVRLKEEYALDSSGGSLVISGAGSLTLVGSAGWISISGNTVTLSENTSYDSRSATLTYSDSEGQAHIVVIVQAQKDAIVISSSELEVGPEGGEIPFVVSANVSVKASSDAAWLTVNPSTKGLEEKIFTITASANDSGAKRSATVSFVSGDLSQTVSIVQDAKSVFSTGGVFYLLEDASSLEAGDRILIVSPDGEYAMGPQTNNNYRGIEAVTASGGIISDISEKVQVITLEGSAGAWNLAVGDGQYLAAQSASSNYLRTISSVTDYAKWSISISGGEASIKASAASRGTICYNANYSRFSCYSAPGTNTRLVSVYKEESSYVPADDPILSKTEAGCYISDKVRTYTKGTDQIVRYGDTSGIRYFVIADPATNEQVSISGFTGNEALGDAVNISLFWKKNGSKLLSGSYRMYVAKVTDSSLWLGNGKGNGFIIKK